MEPNSDFLNCINIARSNPKYYVSLLEAQLASFISSKQMLLNGEIVYEANQGKSAWIQAKHFLLKQTPVPPLQRHDGLCKAAEDHQIDVCKNGRFDHKGSDGSTFCSRILKYCKKGPGAMAEMIGLDFDIPDRKIAELTILGLIVDDGIPDRGHRHTIFNPAYRYIGWSTGKHEQKNVTVFNLLENNLQQIGKNVEGSEKENVVKIIDLKHQKAQKPKRKVLGAFEQISQNIPSLQKQFPFNQTLQKTQSTIEKQPNSFISSGLSSTVLRKRVSQKHQNTKISFEDGAKIIEITTRVVYKDGSIEENVNKKIFYEDD